MNIRSELYPTIKRLGSGRRARQRRGRTGNSGFTLIELLVVLLIMATFVTMVTPSVMQAVRANDIDAISGKMAQTLQFAYASAVSRRQPVLVGLDYAGRRCQVVLDRPRLPWVEEQDAPAQRTLAAMTWPENTRVSLVRNTASASAPGASSALHPGAGEGFDTITFRSNGRTDDVKIELVGEQNERRSIEVIGWTGEVRLLGPEGDQERPVAAP